MLVGRLHPRNGVSSKWLPSGQHSRLVATAALSFHPNSRETFLSLKPPEDEAYLCNIAVDPAFRRKGLARHMLGVAEDLARANGFQALYLHVRLGDDAARLLYDSFGYQEVASDSWLIKMRGRTPNALLVKHIATSGGNHD
jgi:ribosomal protein S18 acetylase RimI-like enzyme